LDMAFEVLVVCQGPVIDSANVPEAPSVAPVEFL